MRFLQELLDFFVKFFQDVAYGLFGDGVAKTIC